MAQEAFDNGAGGYVVKSDAAAELLPAVRAFSKVSGSRKLDGSFPRRRDSECHAHSALVDGDADFRDSLRGWAVQAITPTQTPADVLALTQAAREHGWRFRPSASIQWKSFHSPIERARAY